MFVNICTFPEIRGILKSMGGTSHPGLHPTLWRTCKMLAGEKRIELLRQLYDQPGQSVKELGIAVGIKRSAASQELRRIQSRGLLASHRQGIPLIYRMEPDPQVSSALPLLSALRTALGTASPRWDSKICRIAKGLANERRIAIARALIAQPDTIGNLQRRLSLSRSALVQHLSILRQSGFSCSHSGRYCFSTPAHPVARALARLLQNSR